jgi:hypothetical protein
MPIIIEAAGVGATFEELLDEVFERGFDDLRDGGTQEARVKRWVNQAYREVIDVAPWPFLETSIEGTAPLEVSGLGHVKQVAIAASDTSIPFISRAQVARWDPASDDTGAAEKWFLEGEETINTFPLDTTSTLTVRYVMVPPELVASEDRSVVPAQYAEAIVAGAVNRCLRNRNNYEAAAEERQEMDRIVAKMRHSLLRPNYDANKSIIRTGLPGDYLG